MNDATLITLGAVALGAAAALYMGSRAGWSYTTYTAGAEEGPGQETSYFEDAQIMLDPSTYTTAPSNTSQAADNLGAFLTMIAVAEGTAGPRGYQTMFGYRYFTDYADHPRQYFPFTDLAGKTLKSSAAGRYQIIVKTWDSLRLSLNLPDFSPDSQDKCAIELIRQRGALGDVQAGRLNAAISKCAPVWASLPGAGYNQPERQFSQLLSAYEQAGGQTT
jgi:muramidase (phage lysozyme)